MTKNDYEQIYKKLDILQEEAICHNGDIISFDNRCIVDCRKCEYAIDGASGVECSVKTLKDVLSSRISAMNKLLTV